MLVIIFIAEHGYWLVDRAVGALLERIKTKGEVNVMREDYVLRRKQFCDIGMDASWERKEGPTVKVPSDSPPGFWKQEDVERTVHDGKEFLSMGWNKRKTQ